MDTGAGSLEAVRRQLEGSWTLVGYEAYEGSKPHRIDASAELTYDQYGNLRVRGELKRQEASAVHPVLLNYSGRATIDIATHTLHLVDMVSTGDAPPADVTKSVSVQSLRAYDLQGARLTLTVLSADGQPLASSVWKKASP